MFEFDKYEKQLHEDRELAPQSSYKAVRDIEKMSLLMWGEHCVECAAPSCFTSCDLYQSRPDTRCRRLTYGMYRNPRFPSARGYGAEISFKKWGKIEARGNTLLLPSGITLWTERIVGLSAPLLNAVGAFVHRVTGDARWSYLQHALIERLGRWLHRKNDPNSRQQPDLFLLEVYNPADISVRIQLSMSVASGVSKLSSGQLPPPFRASVILPSGYSRHEFQREQFSRITECGLPFDIAIIPDGEGSARLVFLTADFVVRSETVKVESSSQPKIKCVVWDLDNTMWDGILLENEGVDLRPKVPELLRFFDERGILLSIASKNDESSAWRRLKELGMADYFLYPQINWLPKSENIKAIAEQLNIGLDTFAFIDDNPFELEEVSRALKGVTCVNAEKIADLFSNPRYQGSTNEDARKRSQFYREEFVRRKSATQFGSDYLGFLAACEIKLFVDLYTKDDLERVSELVQRTNQLNFSGRKYQRSEILPILANQEIEKYVLRCTDNYGSYGVVGFCIVRVEESEIRVEDFMLSCRVQGRFIEQAFFNYLVNKPRTQKPESLWVNFKPTGRNIPAQQVLESLNFVSAGDDTGLRADLTLNAFDCNFITVESSC
ncbi:HAD-IIIC family phosphatase [Nitrosospira multiformis]|uniref:HAD-superfamily phosphatase, subfamily IIIC/FkbH-like domain-containing protein n=1 Tax=Nitrosospira multiformis TaxID=1231 RepID=A0A1I7IMR8_9PROT|nr:HAD-IIIC family phosphatase [Nitrosospira multiformis]SFU74231.1 HAD-superfamily phosphatase, subfamily IIIC/FkbH-like domain-containing protein [Nitrosospira multiformis]